MSRPSTGVKTLVIPPLLAPDLYSLSSLHLVLFCIIVTRFPLIVAKQADRERQKPRGDPPAFSLPPRPGSGTPSVAIVGVTALLCPKETTPSGRGEQCLLPHVWSGAFKAHPQGTERVCRKTQCHVGLRCPRSADEVGAACPVSGVLQSGLAPS